MSAFWAFCIKALLFLMAILPLRVQMAVGRFLGWLWFDVLRIRRRVALDNLKIAFPDATEGERIRIARKSCENLGIGFVEFARFPFVQESDKDRFDIEGVEHLRAAEAKGKGVFLLTLHLGNGDWGIVGLALHGIFIHVVTKKFKMKFLNDVWFGMRSRFGTKLIDDRNSSYAILKALRKNGIVAFVLDQFMGPPIGVRTQFFGRETGTAMGLTILTKRSGAAVVPCYTLRKANGRTLVRFEAEIPFEEFENDEETVQKMTQRYTDKIESCVRRYPEQWMWVHRRWKRFKV